MIPKAFAALTGQALASIEETAGPRRRDQADTCTPGEKSGIKRIQPISGEQGTASNRFVRVADKIKVKLIQLTTLQSLKEAAGNRHVWWLEFDRNDRWEERQHWA